MSVEASLSYSFEQNVSPQAIPPIFSSTPSLVPAITLLVDGPSFSEASSTDVQTIIFPPAPTALSSATSTPLEPSLSSIVSLVSISLPGQQAPSDTTAITMASAILSSETGRTPPGSTSGASSNASNIGPILGGVLGGIGFVLIILVVVLVLILRQGRRKKIPYSVAWDQGQKSSSYTAFPVRMRRSRRRSDGDTTVVSSSIIKPPKSSTTSLIADHTSLHTQAARMMADTPPESPTSSRPLYGHIDGRPMSPAYPLSTLSNPRSTRSERAAPRLTLYTDRFDGQSFVSSVMSELQLDHAPPSTADIPPVRQR